MDTFKKEYLVALKRFRKAEKAFDENPNNVTASKLARRRISLNRFSGDLKYTDEFLGEPKTQEHLFLKYRMGHYTRDEYHELRIKLYNS